MSDDRIECVRLKSKIMSAHDAAALIESGATVGMSGFTGSGYPKAVHCQSVGAHRAMTPIEGEARRARCSRDAVCRPGYSAARGVGFRGNAGVAIGARWIRTISTDFHATYISLLTRPAGTLPGQRMMKGTRNEPSIPVT